MPVTLQFWEGEETFSYEVPTVWESPTFAVHQIVDLDLDRKPIEQSPRNRFFRVVHKASGLAFGAAHRQRQAIRLGKLAEKVLGGRGKEDELLKDFHTWMMFGAPWDFSAEAVPRTDVEADWEEWIARRRASRQKAEAATNG